MNNNSLGKKFRHLHINQPRLLRKSFRFFQSIGHRIDLRVQLGQPLAEVFFLWFTELPLHDTAGKHCGS